MNDRPELHRDGPVVLIQSPDDPGDMGEPREWIEDGVTYLVVPSFDLWATPAAEPGLDALTRGYREGRAAVLRELYEDIGEDLERAELIASESSVPASEEERG